MTDDDTDLKMFEIKAGLEEIKEEMERIKEENTNLKNNMAFNSLLEKVDDFQRKNSNRFETMEGNLRTLTTAVSNNDQILSEIRNTLRQQNEALRTINQTLNKHSENIEILKTHAETILLLGGHDIKSQLDSLLILENNRDKWKQLNIKLPYAIYNHGAQFLNNNLYIFGGCNESNKELNWTYKLSKSLQWEKMADMNQKRNGISNSSVILNNQIWVCGGQDGKEILKSVEMYDPETNKWKYMKQMNTCRSYAAAAVVNGKIFCSGGVLANSVECYDPSSNVWTQICNMPQNTSGHIAIEIDGKFIVMGGYDNGYLNSVWGLDTTDKNTRWIKKPSMFIPRRYLSIAKIDDKVFVCGGELIHTTIDSVEIFDGKAWRDGPNMPTDRKYAPAVAIPMQFARSLD